MMPIGQNRPTPETQVYETRLSSFKVNELQSLLANFRVQKIGKKNELYSRCVELLRTPTMTKQVIDKIREIESRVNSQRATPYPLPTMSNHYQQHNQMGGYRPQASMYGGYQMPGLGQYGMNMQQNMNGGGMLSITPRPARNLTPMALPFYDPIHTLVQPQELPASPNGNKQQARLECVFSLSAEHQMKLSISERDFPRTEVQLRFFNTTGDILNIEQADDFPLNVNVRINESQVTLPNVIPTNKPNVEPKRPSRPVNITKELISQPRDRRNIIRIDWAADKRSWAAAIYIVSRVDSQILRRRILQNPSFELPYETTEATIRKRLGGSDDDDVAMDSLKISLLCPLMKTRMGVSARCRDCTHLQCFDLDSYLMLNEKKPAWKCGVCNGNAPYNKLIIDKYFMKMLNDLGPLVTDVELLKDGNYRVIKEDDVCDISDDDECGIKEVVKASSSGGGSKPASVAGAGGSGGAGTPSSSAAPTPAPPVKKDADDIITISDDEDEREVRDLRDAIRASLPSSTTNSDQQTPTKSTPPSSDDSIIILDDTPPRAEPVRPAASSSTSSSASSSSWRPIPTLSTSAGSGSANVTSTSSAAAGGSSSSMASTSASAYGQQQQQQQQRSVTNLSEALAQAGHRPSGVPAQLQLNGGPLSAAATLAQQPNIYNWQQPQSAPPVMNQQQAQNWYQPQMIPHAPQNSYGGYYNNLQYQQQPQQGYGAVWGTPVNQALFSNGVLRGNNELPRDPRDPR